MKQCTRCILPANYRNIQFDTHGVCNYCRTYEKVETRLTDFAYLSQLLEDRFQKVKGRYAYDCVSGLSGGKDSSYLAMQLKEKHGLNVLFVTFDNGFLTDYAKENIKRVTQELDLEHFFYKVDWSLHKSFYEQSVRWFGTPCSGCSFAGYALIHKFAFEKKIPLIIHGRSRSQMLRELLPGSPDAFLPLIKTNISPHDPEAILASTIKAKKKLEYFLRISLRNTKVRKRYYDEFLPDMSAYVSSKMPPEFIGYFLYQAYDERKMMAELEKRLQWKRPTNGEILTHNDCAIHDAAGYLFNKVFGYSVLAFELSVLIREGAISRKEALERLIRESDTDSVPEESMRILCDRLSIPRKEIPAIIKKAGSRQLWKKRILEWKNRILRPKQLDL